MTLSITTKMIVTEFFPKIEENTLSIAAMLKWNFQSRASDPIRRRKQRLAQREDKRGPSDNSHAMDCTRSTGVPGFVPKAAARQRNAHPVAHGEKIRRS